MKKIVVNYCIYALVIGFLGNSLLSVASEKVNTNNNRTALVLQSIGE